MKVLRLGILASVVIAVMLGALASFVFFVKLDFAIHVIGRVEPQRMLDLALPRGGEVAFVRKLGPVKKGDVLVSLATKRERASVEMLDEIDGLLRKQVAHQRELFAAEAKQRKYEIDQCKRRIKGLEEQVDYKEKTFDEATEQIVADKMNRERLTLGLLSKEASILEQLSGRGLISKKELDLAKYRADLSKHALAQLKHQSTLDEVVRTENVKALRRELSLLAAQVKHMEKQPADKMKLLALEMRQAEVQQRRRDLALTLAEKELRAPFSGNLVRTDVELGQIINSHADVGQLLDESSFVFRGKITTNDRLYTKEGQQVQISLDNYPHQQYGYLNGKVALIQTSLESEKAAYPITVDLDKSEFKLYSGLSGNAAVFTFHGTTYEYFVRDRR